MPRENEGNVTLLRPSAVGRIAPNRMKCTEISFEKVRDLFYFWPI